MNAITRTHRLSGVSAVWLLAGLFSTMTVAQAQSSAAALIDGAKPIADVRLRYENVDDASKAFRGEALTLRARLGVQSGVWNGLSLLAEADGVWDVSGGFNTTRNGKSAYPTIADPEMLALNRLQLTYASDFDTSVVIGRQRILFGDQRFVGNSGWRQHEQTFDAVSLTNSSIKGLTANYAYVTRVNRVFGPSQATPASGPTGAFHCDCHLFDAAYAGVPGLKLEAFGLLLDLAQRDGTAGAKLATGKLSTATIGAQASYKLVLSSDVTGQATATYAHQSNYRSNPLAIDLSFWRGEAGITYAGLTGTLGYEALEGNGTAGFSTPLATIHAYDGWADMFLATPANGLDDLYFKGSYAIPAVARVLHIDSMSANLIHRDFAADRTGVGIGSEWDGALEFGYGQASLLLQYAAYQGAGIGSGGFADKSITWVQLAYKY